MSKKLRILFLAIFFLFVVFIATDLIKVRAATVKTVNIYYHKYDGSYDSNGQITWVWFWSEHRDGKDFKGQKLNTVAASEETAGYVRKVSYQITEAEQNDKFGVIFVKSTGVGSWNGSQTGDIYFKLENKDSETANIWFAEGEDTVVQTAEKAKEVKKNKFLLLTFTSLKTIKFKATGTVSNVEVFENGTKVSATLGSNVINLTNNADLGKEYKVNAKVAADTVTGKSVGYDGIFSESAFGNAFNYDGADLGANYTPSKTTFKLWAPISSGITLNLYNAGHPTKFATEDHPGEDNPYDTVVMEKGDKGVWTAVVEGDLDGKYYTYDVTNAGNTNKDVVDPYAKATGVNGIRGMVVNFASNNEKLNPTDWENTPRAEATNKNVDKIIYETHMRDLTASSTWGGNPELAGTYLGFAQKGTTYSKNGITVKTGLDHIIELGVTHVHFLPLMDSEYVDETLLHDEDYKAKAEDGIYNWGYMTKYFFSIEGAYSTNPYDGYARLIEYKTMIQTLHENDINVIMDVVFNHSSTASASSFHLIVPFYYHRTSNGSFTNGSGCGNELASDRYMVNKLIRESCVYFADEFKVDGFRFDLMGLEDVTTMNNVYADVAKVDKNTIVYGEPWTGDGQDWRDNSYHNTLGYAKSAGGSGEYAAAHKGNLNRMPNIGEFADDGREGIRGGNDVPGRDKGWVNGNSSMYDKAVWAMVGGGNKYNSCSNVYTPTSPNNIVNYASCHDNFTLFDQFMASASSTTQAMNQVTQALSIVLTSQGVAFIEGGSEIGRTKGNNHNSYNAGDKTNAVDWSKKITYLSQFNAIKGLVAVRKAHSAFRQTTYNQINNVYKGQGAWYNNGNLIAFHIQDSNDEWKDMYVIHANSIGGTTFTLPSGNWRVAVSTNTSKKLNDQFTTSIKLNANETVVLVNSRDKISIYDESSSDIGGDPEESTLVVNVVGKNIQKPAHSTNKNDIAKVFAVCNDIISNDKIESFGNVGSAYSNASIIFTSKSDYASTTEVYEAFQAVVNSRKLVSEAVEYSYNFAVCPYDFIADLFYYLNN